MRIWTASTTIAIVLASTMLACSSQIAKSSNAEQEFLARIKDSRAAYPGSAMAEAHPELINEHLSWQWPDDKTLVEQGNALCSVQRNSSGFIAANNLQRLPFLRSYPINQRFALQYAAVETLCPEQGIEQYSP